MALQNHIHLATTLGSAPETSPVYKWTVTDRLEIPVKFMSIRQTRNGRLRLHTLVDTGVTVQLTNYKFTVKVQAEYTYTLAQRITQLRAMDGKFAYLCDSFHAADAASHVSDTKVVVVSLSEFPAIGPGLQYFLVDVELIDASRT